MSGWDGLVATALLGTQRREVDTAVLPESVRRAAESAGDEDPARVLLTAAALLTGYRKAGRLPVREVAPLSVAAPDDRALVPARARRRLAALLTGDRIYLLGEWLSAIAERGFRVPPEALPDLAEAARGRTDLRRPVAFAAGPRGTWLAALRPEWAFLAEGTVSPEVWRFGTVGQRHTWLADLRAVEPDQAREALAEVWGSEPAPVRVRFLAVLRAGLSTSDEEFLESALDDRAQDVRALAAELLTALPGSALSGRMADRLRALISLQHKVLVVRLPGSCTKAMQRDGLSQKAPRGIGARAWWLGQLVSAAPLSVWASVGSPGELVRMAVEGTDPRLLGLGWAAAAVRERDAEWLEALLDGEVTLAMDQVAAMVAVLPRDRWAPVVKRLARDKLNTGLFQALPAPWPAELGTYVLDRLAAHRDERAVAHVADIAARAVPRECFGHKLLGETLGYDASPWRRRLVDTLIFRRSMYEELS